MKKTLLRQTILAVEDREYISKFIPRTEPKLPQDKELIKVCEPDLKDKELDNVIECVKSGWVSSQGKYVTDLEQRFAEYCGSQYAVSVTNGTHALHLPLAAIDIQPGDEVIIPTFTMIATANAVRYLGGIPVFVDARPDTWCIDETQIEAAITAKTKAIIVVHIYGNMTEMDTVIRIAKKHNLWLIEDAAEAHGAVYKGKKAGSIGDIGSFSFYANKMMTTGEGGIVITNNKELYALMYKLHNHAFADDIHFWHEYLGYNYRMTNLQAAVGCAQLERIDKHVDQRRQNAVLYMTLMKNLPGIQFPVEHNNTQNTYWMFGIVLQKEFPLSRDALREYLAQHGIETRTFFIPMHFQPIYFTDQKTAEKFPVANALCRNGLYLPSASTLSEKQIRFVCSVIANASKLKKMSNMKTV